MLTSVQLPGYYSVDLSGFYNWKCDRKAIVIKVQEARITLVHACGTNKQQYFESNLTARLTTGIQNVSKIIVIV